MTGTLAWLLSQGYTNKKIKELGSLLIFKGSIYFADLPTTFSSDNQGWVWNIIDDFTTDDRFVEGPGKHVEAGTNVVVIDSGGGVYKLDLLSTGGGGAFVATYGTTTYDEVRYAISSGKVAYAKKDNVIYQQIYDDGTKVIFATTYNNMAWLDPTGDDTEVFSDAFSIDSSGWKRPEPEFYFLHKLSADGRTGLQIDAIDKTDKVLPISVKVDDDSIKINDENKLYTDRSKVTVSATGTATDEIKYITIDGVEKKIAGGGGGGSSTDMVPCGGIIFYGGDVPAENFLLCDASEVSRTTYEQLFNVIGTRYGAGDGSTTFNLPDIVAPAGVGVWLIKYTTVKISTIGLIIPFGGSYAPTGYILCNGQAVSRTEYSALFDLVGTKYGAGDGTTTFNVPDLGDSGNSWVIKATND